MEERWFGLKSDTTMLARVGAIAEPAFVLIAGTLLARIALSRLGAPLAEHYLYDLNVPDFLSAAAAQFLNLTFSFAIILVLAILLGLWRGRSAAASYGLTLGNTGVLGLVGVGILLGLVASVPEQIVRLVSEYVRLGPGTRFWALETRVRWDANFWIYMAVGSYLVVPIFEELFTRGYVLGRVRESFSPGGTLIAMAAFFTLAHGQYRHLDALALGAQVSLFVWAGICGYAVYRTGSLIPPIIAHGIINVPITVRLRWVMLALSLLILAACWKPFASWANGVIATFRSVDDWGATALAVFAIALIFASIGSSARMPYVWVGILGCISVFVAITHSSPWNEWRQSARRDVAA